MSLYFWFHHLTRGMEIYWSISKPKLSNPIPLAHKNDVFDIKPKIIWSLVKPFTIMVLIRFYRGDSLMSKLRNFWMISILVLVVDIYLVILPHKIFSVLVTSGQLYSTIALLLSEVVMHAILLIVRIDYHLHHCIQSSMLAHSPNGALTLWHVTPPRPGGMGISWSPLTILPNGPRWCQHWTTVVKWLLYFSSTMWLLGLVYHKP